MLLIKELPKIELHSHLDCSLSFSAVQKMIPTITKTQYRQQFNAPAKCIDLSHYLECAQVSVNLLQTKKNLSIAVEDLIQQQLFDKVIYSEIRFAPFEHTKKGLDAEDIIITVLDTLHQCTSRFPIQSNLILCTLRHYAKEQSLKTAEFAIKYHSDGVAALDLASDEANYPIDPHIPAFTKMWNAGIPTTAHAGEAAGPQSVIETIDLLKPTRIGHGVRAIEDPIAIKKIKENNIHLEICPSSNIQTNVYNTYADHAVNKIKKTGVSFGINTDARAITDISLNKEYYNLVKYFKWCKQDFWDINKQALKHAFITEELKSDLLAELAVGYE